MLVLLAALIVAAAVAWTGTHIASALAPRQGPAVPSTAEIMAVLAPALTAVAQDPKALLVWQPLAQTLRTLFPRELAAIDAAAGKTFPFSADDIQAAHSRWTTEWLAWERMHDADFKLKALQLEQELAGAAVTPAGRARLEAVEREKLDRYQRRYEEYTRIARGLQALAPKP